MNMSDDESVVSDLLAAALASQFVRNDANEEDSTSRNKKHRKHKKHKKGKESKRKSKRKVSDKSARKSEKSERKKWKRNEEHLCEHDHDTRKRRKTSSHDLLHDHAEFFPKRIRSSRSSQKRHESQEHSSSRNDECSEHCENAYKAVFETARSEKSTDDDLSDLSAVQLQALQKEKSPPTKMTVKRMVIKKCSTSHYLEEKVSKLVIAKETEKEMRKDKIEASNDCMKMRPKEVDYCLVNEPVKSITNVVQQTVFADNIKQTDSLFKVPTLPEPKVVHSRKESSKKGQEEINNSVLRENEREESINKPQETSTSSEFNCLLLQALGLEEEEEGEIDSANEKKQGREKKEKRKEKVARKERDRHRDKSRDRLQDKIHYDDYDYDESSDRHSSSSYSSKSDRHSSCSSSSYDKRNLRDYDSEKYYCSDEYAYVKYYEDKSAKENYYYGSYYEGSERENERRCYNESKKHYEDYYNDDYYRDRNTRSSSSYQSRYSDYNSQERSHHSRDRKHNERNSSGYKRERIDKRKLYAIAKENLVKMIEKGDVPKGIEMNKLKFSHLKELSTQNSVQQYTEFCRAISSLESAVCNDSDLSSDGDDDDDETKSVISEPGLTIVHPYQVKEKKDIEIKVRDFVQLKSRSASELAIDLRSSFPVSSGNQHRLKESEWKEVEALPPPPPKKANKSDETKKPKKQQEDLSITGKLAPVTVTDRSDNIESLDSMAHCPANPASDGSVFPQSSTMPIDVGSVMAQRLSAMKKLEEEPHNVVALKQLYQAQQMMKEWAESKIVPGQFYGSTDANVLTGDQLNGPSVTAWTRKDQFKSALPINEGIGMYLLIKMGWVPGQGLGKNNEGAIEPLCPNIKMDKKGLIAEEEQVRNLPMQLVSVPTDSGKHPSSMLHEFCMKRKYGPPIYELVHEDGPPHRKSFTFKVIVNSVEYQPSISSQNKKQARALAAGVCLQAFGLLPKDNG